jgi:hypothetical protein
VRKKLWWFFSLKIQSALVFKFRALPCGIISSVAYFPTPKLSSLHLVIFRPHISFIWNLILKILWVVKLAHHSFYIYHLVFYLKENFLPSNSKKMLWSNKFPKVSLVESFFLKIKITFASYKTLVFESWLQDLIFSYTLACCRHIYLISIDFKSIDNNLDTPPKKIILLLQLL